MIFMERLVKKKDVLIIVITMVNVTQRHLSVSATKDIKELIVQRLMLYMVTLI